MNSKRYRKLMSSAKHSAKLNFNFGKIGTGRLSKIKLIPRDQTKKVYQLIFSNRNSST